MNVINVIELDNDTILGIRSFVIPDGVSHTEIAEKADKHFAVCVKENYPDASDDDIDTYLENGYFEDSSGYQCVIAWSNSVE